MSAGCEGVFTYEGNGNTYIHTKIDWKEECQVLKEVEIRLLKLRMVPGGNFKREGLDYRQTLQDYC